MTWELIWMLVILKIPVVYLGLVVWWAVRREPRPAEPVLHTAEIGPDPRPGWRFSRLRPQRPGRGPHGTPARRPGRRVRTPEPTR